jgi:hypothetical protein
MRPASPAKVVPAPAGRGVAAAGAVAARLMAAAKAREAVRVKMRIVTLLDQGETSGITAVFPRRSQGEVASPTQGTGPRGAPTGSHAVVTVHVPHHVAATVVVVAHHVAAVMVVTHVVVMAVHPLHAHRDHL